MAAVGFSFIVDRNGFFSTGDTGGQHDFLTAESELKRLNSHYNNLLSNKSRFLLLDSDFSKAQKTLASVLERKFKLEERRNELLISIDSLQEKFASYQNEVRKKIWAESAGNIIGTLKIKGGIEYFEASIQKVTDSGLDIRHKYGFARIQASDLDDDFHERFQWRYRDRRDRNH